MFNVVLTFESVESRKVKTLLNLLFFKLSNILKGFESKISFTQPARRISSNYVIIHSGNYSKHVCMLSRNGPGAVE